MYTVSTYKSFKVNLALFQTLFDQILPKIYNVDNVYYAL